MLIAGTAFSTAGGLKIARLMLIFEKLVNKKKYTSTFNEKNYSNLPPLISQQQYNSVKECQHISGHIIKQNK